MLNDEKTLLHMQKTNDTNTKNPKENGPNLHEMPSAGADTQTSLSIGAENTV